MRTFLHPAFCYCLLLLLLDYFPPLETVNINPTSTPPEFFCVGSTAHSCSVPRCCHLSILSVLTETQACQCDHAEGGHPRKWALVLRVWVHERKFVSADDKQVCIVCLQSRSALCHSSPLRVSFCLSLQDSAVSWIRCEKYYVSDTTRAGVHSQTGYVDQFWISSEWQHRVLHAPAFHFQGFSIETWSLRIFSAWALSWWRSPTLGLCVKSDLDHRTQTTSQRDGKHLSLSLYWHCSCFCWDGEGLG